MNEWIVYTVFAIVVFGFHTLSRVIIMKKEEHITSQEHILFFIFFVILFNTVVYFGNMFPLILNDSLALIFFVLLPYIAIEPFMIYRLLLKRTVEKERESADVAIKLLFTSIIIYFAEYLVAVLIIMAYASQFTK